MDELLKTLGIKVSSRNVYRDIMEHGPSAAVTIAKRLSMPKTTVYDCLEDLLQSGIVVSYPVDRTTLFGVNDPMSVKSALQNEQREVSKMIDSFDTIIKNSYVSTGNVKPKIRFFEGQKGIQQALYDILNFKDITLYTMWPMQKMIDSVGGEFIEFHNNRRVQLGINLKSIRHNNDRNSKLYKQLTGSQDDKEFLRQTRFAPKEYQWGMGMVIYNDSCLFASSGGELFAYIIQSKEFAELMKLQWKAVWDVSSK